MPRTRLKAAGILCGLYSPELGYAGHNLVQRALLNTAALPWLGPIALRWFSRRRVRWLRERDAVGGAEAVREALEPEMKLLSPVDYGVWTTNEGGLRDMLVTTIRATVQNKDAAEAMAQEAVLIARSWGFRLGDLDAEGRLALWHGTADSVVPIQMTREAKKALGEGVELRVCEGEGHGSLAVRKADEVVGWVKERVKEA